MPGFFFAALPATGRLREAIDVLETNPLIGRPAGGDKRELVIGRGAHGYLALYCHVAQILTRCLCWPFACNVRRALPGRDVRSSLIAVARRPCYSMRCHLTRASRCRRSLRATPTLPTGIACTPLPRSRRNASLPA
ncbi:hypothetical protein FHY18_001451 [Xanthomonas arboricola]|uniref:hypothetical protein n=1 Tax=Xanthomonas sp. 3793 TaxID=3035312 RepID=UPI0021682418|nr:hypothetical protein [Xanthomonas sp. 3793]MCS3745890.1 hypothetical protein [Xanthomonas sp. 3793]